MLRRVLSAALLIAVCGAQFGFGSTDVYAKDRVDVAAEQASVAQSDRPDRVPGEYVVQYKSSQGGALSQKNRRGVRLSRGGDNTVASLQRRSGADVEVIDNKKGIARARGTAREIAALEDDPEVLRIEPNYQYYPTGVSTSDTYAGDLYGLEYIDAESAWSQTDAASSSDVIVAVIDTGVAYTHPDLAAEMWDGTNCVDEYGAALGGCVHGYDFADDDTDPLPDVDTPETNNGMHGTHVAGIIAATRGNTEGVAGVASNARIMALKSTLTSTQIISAIAFAEENGAQVINASYGGGSESEIMRDAIASSSAVFVAAAGNSANDNDVNAFYPCAYDLENVICVTATDDDDELAWYGSYGATSVDVAAPGSGIMSTVPTNEVFIENLENVSTSSLPIGWERGDETQNGWQVATTSNGTFLYADDQYPYADNASSTITTPAVDLESDGTFAAQLSFGLRCETEQTTSTWEDYLSVGWSTDGGTTFTEGEADYLLEHTPSDTVGRTTQPLTLRFDEEQLNMSGLNSDALPGYGAKVYIDLPESSYSADTRFQFTWNTNDSDNNYMGCRISDIGVTRFDAAGAYDSKTGTSMATPHVSGLAALLLGYNTDLTPALVKSAILGSGDALQTLSGKTVSGMRINAGRAVSWVDYEKDITSLTVSNISDATTTINSASSTVDIAVPYGSDLSSSTLEYDVSLGATAEPASGATFNLSTTTASITVTSDDGSKKVWTLFASEGDPSAANYFTTFAFDSVTHDQAVINHASGTVTITVPYGTDRSALTPTFEVSAGAAATTTAGDSLDFSSPVTYIVTAQDGTTREYVVTVTEALNDAANIETFSIPDADIDISGNEITVTVPHDANINVLTPTFTLSPNATASIDSGNEQDFEVLQEIVVTAQDGTTKTYTITLIQEDEPEESTSGGGGGSSGGGGGSSGNTTTFGCTDEDATNYEEDADRDNGSCVYPQVLGVSTTTAPAVTPVAQPAGYTFTRDMTVGATGAEVTALQKRLVAEGVLTMPVGVSYGYFGQLTKNAVIAYQQKYGISPTSGYVGPLTRAQLNTGSGSAVPSNGVANSARAQLIAALEAQIKVLLAQLASMMAAQLR